MKHETMPRNEVRVGDVVEADGVTGRVAQTFSPMGHGRLLRGEIALLLSTRDGDVSLPMSCEPVRRLVPVAADQWMQENLP